MTGPSYPPDGEAASGKSWRERRGPKRLVLARVVTELVGPDVFPCPRPHESKLVALRRVWRFERKFERARSWDEWTLLSWGAAPGSRVTARVALPRAGGAFSFHQGEAWSWREIAHRGIIWHLTQDLPHEAGWVERWTTLQIPPGRWAYVVKHCGPQLGLL